MESGYIRTARMAASDAREAIHRCSEATASASQPPTVAVICGCQTRRVHVCAGGWSVLCRRPNRTSASPARSRRFPTQLSTRSLALHRHSPTMQPSNNGSCRRACEKKKSAQGLAAKKVDGHDALVQMLTPPPCRIAAGFHAAIRAAGFPDIPPSCPQQFHSAGIPCVHYAREARPSVTRTRPEGCHG